MSNITKRDTGATTWNPFRSVRDFFGWDPFREMTPLLGGPESLQDDSWIPHVEVRETKDAFVFQADVPGVEKDDLDVTLSGNRLQIAGRRDAERETKDDTVYTYERSFGSFTRAFTLPADVDADQIRTDLADGVLTLVVPKRASVEAKTITIGAGSKA